jgi:hypothetical protein
VISRLRTAKADQDRKLDFPLALLVKIDESGRLDSLVS